MKQDGRIKVTGHCNVLNGTNLPPAIIVDKNRTFHMLKIITNTLDYKSVYRFV
jgi:hypothetical protein